MWNTCEWLKLGLLGLQEGSGLSLSCTGGANKRRFDSFEGWNAFWDLLKCSQKDSLMRWHYKVWWETINPSFVTVSPVSIRHGWTYVYVLHALTALKTSSLRLHSENPHTDQDFCLHDVCYIEHMWDLKCTDYMKCEGGRCTVVDTGN